MPKKLFLLSFLFLFVIGVHAQLLNHYWVHNYNSTSSLLGGAVVAGDADNTAIFYNPATITQMQKGSNLSLAANLFSWNFYNFYDLLGDGINMTTNNFLVQPQFISFTYSPKNSRGISLAFAALTRIKERIEMNYTDARFVDVIHRYPGEEKYNTQFNYRNDYSDSWVGIAMAHDINDKFSYGISMFTSFSTLKYDYGWSATAYNPNDTIGFVDFKLSEGSYNESLQFTDYRLIFKLGISYELKRWRFGLTFTSPSLRLFSGGKSASRVEKQSNIAYDGKLLPDYIVFDGQSKDELKTNYKLPWSIAFGFIHDIPHRGSKFYFTTEYFSRIDTYRMVDAQVNQNITTPSLENELGEIDWLSYMYGSNAILNVAVGYSWTLKKGLTFLNALRTDFSAVYNYKIDEGTDLNYIKTTEYNIYHYSGGVKFSIKKQRFIAGGDFAFGYRTNSKQSANFSDPVEYEPVSGRALQGPLNENSDTYYFGFSVYVGATLNFSKDSEPIKK